LKNCYDSAIQRAEYQSLLSTSSVSTLSRNLLNIYQLPREKRGFMQRQDFPIPTANIIGSLIKTKPNLDEALP
jgi:hypothetical protein